MNYFFSVALLEGDAMSRSSVPPRWQISGLLEEFISSDDSTSYFGVACNLIRNAIFYFLSLDIKFSLGIMAVDKNTQWRALELMVLTGLIQCDLKITLHAERSSTVLHCSRGKDDLIIFQERPRTVAKKSLYPFMKMSPGTLVVCYQCHRVVDFVLFSAEKKLFFFQVSKSDYSAATKLSGLFKREYFFENMKGKNPVSLYYMFNVMAGFRVKVGDKSLSSNCHYIYVTASVQKRVLIDDDAIILPRTELFSLFNDNWRHIESYFK